MEIDHLFIFSDQQGREADQLVEFGLLEGSHRSHPGQGTTNRKFYFENFFLEIVWVVDEAELNSPQTSVTRLWERSQFRTNGASRFGLGLVNTADTQALFADSLSYQPVYTSEGQAFDILPHADSPYLPWTFRPPVPAAQVFRNEPRHHPNSLRRLTGVTFVIPDTGSAFVEMISDHSIVHFEQHPAISLTLEFDQGIAGRSHYFEELDLRIMY